MDFELTEEQRMIRDMARDFAAEVVAPRAAEIDRTEEYPMDTLKHMGGLGLMAIDVPEEYGGIGADTVSYVLAMEEINKACAATGTVMSVNNSLICHALVEWGSDHQKETYLRPATTFQKIGAYALSEPQAGSDAANQKTLAVREDAHYVVNGSKNFITNGSVADFVILFCRTDPQEKHRGISCLLVDADSDGFSAGKPEDKLGIRASATTTLSLEDCRVPVENRMSEEGEGFAIAMSILDTGRIGIAAQAVGIAQAAFEASVAYAKERQTFGKPIAQHQAIQFMIADMATRIEAARLLTLKAARLKDQGKPHSRAASMAKLYASETAGRVTDKAIQVHGGYGYMKEYAVERYFRDAKITQIYEGTSEVQRMVIAA
ncbi:MAG: acyl-CoA dehydrogenase, partial [Anaerolineae bacterium]